MFDWLIDLATSSWAYLVTAGVVLVDGLVGLIPSETVLHGAGVGASRGGVSPLVVIVIAAASAVAGDLLAFTVGAKGGTSLRKKLVRSEKGERRARAVRDQLDDRPWLLTVARFVPGLRTVTMYSAGSLSFPRGRFLAYEAPGALAWAAYNVLIGYFLGLLFKHASFWVPFLVSAGIAGLLTLVFELVRRARLESTE